MRAYFSILSLLYVFQLSSCSDEKTTEKKDVEKNYFSDAEVPDSAIDFKNEMATGETDFLRSLSTHQIAWQKWNHEILRKAALFFSSAERRYPKLAISGFTVESITVQIAWLEIIPRRSWFSFSSSTTVREALPRGEHKRAKIGR